jgi:hypothetical protein
MEFFHYSTRILDNIEEFREDIHSVLIIRTKVEVKYSIFDEFIHQEDLKMCLLLFFLQNFDNFGICTLIVAEDAMML